MGLAREMVRMLGHVPGPTDRALEKGLNAAALRVLSRQLTPSEMLTLKNFYAEAVSISARDSASGSRPELTALISTSSVLLNLDAALTR